MKNINIDKILKKPKQELFSASSVLKDGTFLQCVII